MLQKHAFKSWRESQVCDDLNYCAQLKRMTNNNCHQAKVRCVLLLLLVTMLMTEVQARLHSRAKRDKRGCCPSSYTGKYLRVATGEPGTKETFYCDQENQRFVQDFHGTRDVSQINGGMMVNDKQDCIMYDWKNDVNPLDFICLSSNAVYQGQQTVQLADGETKLVDVYEMTMEGFVVTKYFALDDVNCIPIGEKWFVSPNQVVDYKLQDVELGQPAASKFVVPTRKCSEIQ